MRIIDKAKTWANDNPEVIVGGLLLALASFLIARFWYRLITDHYFVLQVILTTVMAVLIVEVVTITDPKGLTEGIHGLGKTGAQAFILGGLVFSALFSNLFIWELERAFGHVFLIQLLGLLVIISRLYVNVSEPSGPGIGARRSNDVSLGIFDEQPDTYAIYVFGLIAIFLPSLIPRIYPLDSNITSSVTFGIAVFFSISYYAVNRSD